MGRRLALAVDHVLKERELLVQHMRSAKACRDEWQVMRVAYLIDTLDGLLAIATCGETRH